MTTNLPDGLTIFVDRDEVLATHPKTRSTFVITGELSKENVARQCAAHLDRWIADELQFAPALQGLREAGYLPADLAGSDFAPVP